MTDVPPPPPTPQPQSPYPEASQAVTALVLGIVSVVACQILGPFAWSMGNKELAAIDAGRRPPENRSNANAGRILGIIGTVMLGLGLLVIVALVAFGTLAAVTSS